MGSVFPQRKSLRLTGYDYTLAGAYFVTICSHERTHLFGQVQDGTMVLNSAGEIAAARWLALPKHHPGIELDAFVVMPNHVHGIGKKTRFSPCQFASSDYEGILLCTCAAPSRQ